LAYSGRIYYLSFLAGRPVSLFFPYFLNRPKELRFSVQKSGNLLSAGNFSAIGTVSCQQNRQTPQIANKAAEGGRWKVEGAR
jgi:hypothetical protein